MKLFNSLGPNPHVVRMFAAEKGIALPLQAVDVMGSEHRRPPYSDMNVMLQTPALQTDDGQVICEVTAICEYLEELHPQPPLVGATPAERAETRMWCRRIDLNILEGRSRAFRATGGREFFFCAMYFRAPEGGSNLPTGLQNLPGWFERVRARPAVSA